MRLVRRALVAVIMLGASLGVVVATQGPAHAAGYAQCQTSGDFFLVHAPAYINGGLQAWATCVAAGTYVDLTFDGKLNAGQGIDALYLQRQEPGNVWWNKAVNYESSRWIPRGGNTVIVAYACTTSAVTNWSTAETVSSGWPTYAPSGGLGVARGCW